MARDETFEMLSSVIIDHLLTTHSDKAEGEAMKAQT